MAFVPGVPPPALYSAIWMRIRALLPPCWNSFSRHQGSRIDPADREAVGEMEVVADVAAIPGAGHAQVNAQHPVKRYTAS